MLSPQPVHSLAAHLGTLPRRLGRGGLGCCWLCWFWSGGTCGCLHGSPFRARAGGKYLASLWYGLVLVGMGFVGGMEGSVAGGPLSRFQIPWRVLVGCRCQQPRPFRVGCPVAYSCFVCMCMRALAETRSCVGNWTGSCLVTVVTCCYWMQQRGSDSKIALGLQHPPTLPRGTGQACGLCNRPTMHAMAWDCLGWQHIHAMWDSSVLRFPGIAVSLDRTAGQTSVADELLAAKPPRTAVSGCRVRVPGCIACLGNSAACGLQRAGRLPCPTHALHRRGGCRCLRRSLRLRP